MDKHTASLEVLAAISWWIKSKREQGVNPNPKVSELMPTMYKTLDSIYLETRGLPFRTISGAFKKRPHDKSDAFIFGLWLKNRDYIALRSILALAGDLIYVSDKLKNLQQPPEIGNFIVSIFKQADQFRDARDFFTHMDDALRDHSKHGISGPATLECGVQFGPNAKNNVYVIWDNNTLYFSFENKQRTIVMDKPAFDEIFNQAGLLYAEIINNPVSRESKNVKGSDQIYPLN